MVGMNSLHCEYLLEHLAERLQQGGVEHPQVAAAVLAARGATRTDQAAYARKLRIKIADLRQAEAGHLPIDQLPAPLRHDVEQITRRTD